MYLVRLIRRISGTSKREGASSKNSAIVSKSLQSAERHQADSCVRNDSNTNMHPRVYRVASDVRADGGEEAIGECAGA